MALGTHDDPVTLDDPQKSLWAVSCRNYFLSVSPGRRKHASIRLWIILINWVMILLLSLVHLFFFPAPQVQCHLVPEHTRINDSCINVYVKVSLDCFSSDSRVSMNKQTFPKCRSTFVSTRNDILAPVCTSRESSLHSSHKTRHEFENQNKTADDVLKVFPGDLKTLFVLVSVQHVENGINHFHFGSNWHKNIDVFCKNPICLLTVTTLSVHLFIISSYKTLSL